MKEQSIILTAGFLIAVLVSVLSLMVEDKGQTQGARIASEVSPSSVGEVCSGVGACIPLAEAGDVSAQFVLGRMYFEGVGVPQDYISAYKWLNLSAAQGEKQAVAERDAVSRFMTLEQIAEAQRLSREWTQKISEN